MKRMNLSLDAALWEALRMRCLQRHVSASKQVGVLLTQWLQEHAPQEDKSAEAEKRSPLGINPRGLRGLKPTKAVIPASAGLPRAASPLVAAVGAGETPALPGKTTLYRRIYA